MALPKLSTGALNIYADPPLGSDISPTTSPAASSKQEDSDPNYTLNYEEPLNLKVKPGKKSLLKSWAVWQDNALSNLLSYVQVIR